MQVSRVLCCIAVVVFSANFACGRDEDKIMRACYWPHEVYDSCFGGCAEVSCDNPSSHLRPCYPYCEPGCVCDQPYVRDDRTHQCVLRTDCTMTQMGIPVRPSGQEATSQHAAGGRSTRSSGQPAPAVPTDFSVDRSGQAVYRSGQDGYLPGQDIYRSGHDGYRSGQDGYRSGQDGYRSGQDGYRSGQDGYRFGQDGYTGNYFNIVIAPPPVNPLQLRKTLDSDYFHSNGMQ